MGEGVLIKLRNGARVGPMLRPRAAVARCFFFFVIAQLSATQLKAKLT